MPTTVNQQITDAITQTNVKVVGEAPAQAMAIDLSTLPEIPESTTIENTENTQPENTLEQLENNFDSIEKE